MAFRIRRALDVLFGLEVVYQTFEHGVRVSGCEVDGIEFVAGSRGNISVSCRRGVSSGNPPDSERVC